MLQRTLFIMLIVVWAPLRAEEAQSRLDESERLFFAGRLAEAQTVLAAGEGSELELDPEFRLLFGAQRSKLSVFRGIHSRQRAHFESALAIVRSEEDTVAQVDDPGIRAVFAMALANAHLFNTHVSPFNRDIAVRQFREAKLLFVEAGDRSGEALARAFLIMLRFTRARADQDTEALLDLIPEFEAEIVFSRVAGNRMALAYNQRHLAAIHREVTRELKKSSTLYAASLDTRLAIGFQPLIPASHASVGDVLENLGKSGQAIAWFEKSIETADAIGFRRYQFSSRIKLGDLLQLDGRRDEARARYDEALRVAEEHGTPAEVAEATGRLEEIRANR